jgi:hypothetical protein
MEPRFGKVLTRYNELAKRERAKSQERGDLAEIKEEIAKAVEEEAGKRGMTTDSARQIFNLQREKMRVVAWLRGELAKLDDEPGPEIPDPEKRKIGQNGEGLVWIRADGTTQKVTPGEVLTDGIWGVEYDFGRDVPRGLRKRYLIEKAKRSIGKYLDYQLGVDQRKSRQSDPRLRGGYSGLLKSRERMETEGHLAERIVYSFLKKVSLDHGFPFAIEAANVYEDIELKIDFILKVKNKQRGLAVEGDDDVRTVGIQFTIGRGSKEKKIVQVGEAKPRAKEMGIDDIVIVRLQLKELHRMFAAWSVNKPPGGPDGYWDDQTKVEILKGVLQGLFEKEEIDEMCSRLAPQNPFAGG